MAGGSTVRSIAAYQKWLIAGLIVSIAYTLFGFFGLPAILKAVLPKTLSDTLHRKTTVREIRFNPFDLSISIRGLEVEEREGKGTWISAGEIYGNLEFVSIFRGGPVLREIRLVKPYASIVRHPDGSYNFMDLVEEFSKKPAKPTKPLNYSLNNIRVIDGRIDFDDGPKKTRHEVGGIHLDVPFLSNLPYYVERYIQPSFAATVNGKAVSLKGRTKPFSDTRETVFDVNVADLDIPHYLAYLPVRRDYEVSSAYLDVKGTISFSQPKGKSPIVRVGGDVSLRQLRIEGAGRTPMVSLPMTKVTILPSDVVARELRVSRLTVTDPEIDATIDRKGKFNLLVLSAGNDKDIAKSGGGTESVPSNSKGTPSTKVSVETIRLSGGKVRFSDASREVSFKTALGDIRIDVDRLTTEEGKAADALLSLRTEAGETLDWKGKLAISPFSSEGMVSLGRVVLKKYAPYYAAAVRFDVTGGMLDMNSAYRVARKEGETEVLISGLSASLVDLRLKRRDDAEEFLRVPKLSVKDATIDFAKREVSIEEVATAKGIVEMRRNPGGELNLAGLMAEDRPQVAASAPGSSAGKSEGKVPPEKPWVVNLRKAAVERYAVRFVDRTTDPPADLSLNPLQIKAENVSTGRNRRGKASFSATVAKEGTVSVGGAFSIDPPSLRAKVRVKSLPIAPVQPYFADKVRILVTGGAVSAEGDLSIDVPKGKAMSVVYKGEASVNGFASVDKARGEEFLKFASLHFGGVEVGNEPPKVAIGEVALSDFFSRLVVNPDATLNVQRIMVKGAAASDNTTAKPVIAPSAEATKAVPTPVRIDTVTLHGGAILFSDRYVKPNYTASLVEIGGRVSGLSSEESRQADVDLRGKLENSAPLEIRGKINPLAENLFVDLMVDFRDMDLSSLSPYTGRYAGYGIRKGKLALGLKYHIEKKKLDAENKVFLDQFTFGEAVDSPDATKLPVRLAVALLKDRKGEIHLDLPVTGQIDDPKFSVWGIVVKILVNLLVKAATSPFALLGAVFGGGEELSYLEFDPGMTALPGTSEAKIGSLAKVLAERPALQLEIEGHVDVQKDTEEWRRILFRRKVAARKLRDLVRSGEAAPALDNVRVDAAEYPKYLAQAYKGEKFPKPRNILGMAKDLPVAEMEKLMLAHTTVTNDDLRQIALKRASNVKDRLIGTGKVEPGRIYLVEPKTLPPERKEKLRDSRVDFRIK